MSNPQHSDHSRLPRIFWLAMVLVAICAAVFLTQRGNNRNEETRSQASVHSDSSHASRPEDRSRAASGASSEQNHSPSDVAPTKATSPVSENLPSDDGPKITRATRRDDVISDSGARKALVDPMASWENPPPWPEGPRLFAEVETATRKYVNLRPDDIGELPRIHTSAKERIELRVYFPEGTPGEKIFVEIPNGGAFPDADKTFAKVYQLQENRTISLPYVTDDERGYCTVTLRHRGHTRSLPIWVGELPQTAPSDS